MSFNKFIISFLGIIISFILSPEIMSQTEATGKKISLGFEGGVQFTKIYDSWAYSALPNSKVDFNMGVFADYCCHPSIKIRLGAYYDNRGFKIQDVISPISELQSDDSIYTSYPSYFASNLVYNLNYLTIPFSLFYEKGNDKFNIYIQGGVFYSLLLSANKTGNTNLYIYPDHAENFEDPKLRNPGNTITEYNKEDIIDLFVGNDWGIQFFFGIVYHLNEKLDLQFSPGFAVSFEHLYADPSRNSKWNNNYKINAGIIYSLN